MLESDRGSFWRRAAVRQQGGLYVTLSTDVNSRVSHHIVQRGHDRKPIFAALADYRFYLENLSEHKRRLGVDVLAYCLMTNIYT